MPKGLVRTTVLVAAALLGAALVVVPGSWVVLDSENARFAAAQRAQTQLVLAEAKVALEASLAARLTSLRALAAFAASQPDVGEAEFAIFAQGLAASLPDIRSVQLARNFVVSHLYPQSRNNGILGLDLRAHLPPAQQAALERAVDANAPVLDGPVPLLQGGIGLIIRSPVLAPHGGGQPPQRWGLATIILDADAFFAQATPPDSGIRLAIRSAGQTDRENRLLFGHGAVFNDAPVLLNLETPGGLWQLAATPALGWTAMTTPPTLVGGSCAAWLALSAAFFILLIWPTRLRTAVAAATAALDAARQDLERTVAERTSALVAANETLGALYDHAPVGIFTSTPDGHYLKANAFLARMYGFDTPEALLDHVASIQDQIYVDFTERQRLLELLTTRGSLSNHEIRRLTRAGDVIWVSLNILAVRDDAGDIVRLEGFCTDVTKRKLAEAALARQERELRIIFENSPLGLVAFDPDGAIVKGNQRFLALMGTTAEQIQGANLVPRMPAFVREALMGALAGEPSQAEGPYTSVLGGRSLNIRAVFNPVLTGQDPSPVIASVEDISERRAQEQRLRLLRAAVEQSPASIVITDENGSIEYVNPYFTELTGYSAAEARGKTPRVLSSGIHDKAFFQAMWQVLQAGNIWRGELCNRKRNGDLYWEDSSISPIRDDQGRITHFVAVKEDITERKEREARLHQLMTEYEAIFNASSVGIVHLDSEARVVRANRCFGVLFGIAPETLAGRGLDAIHEAEPRRETLRREVLAAVAEGREASVEERFRNRSGQVVWCSIHGRRIDAERPQAGSLWIFDDITARKDLEAIREDVERIMRHDLKAPLNSILNLPELVAALGETTQEQRDILNEIEQSGRLMLDQIDLSLDLYKMETGTYAPEVQRIDLTRIVTTAAEMLVTLAKARGVTIDLPPGQVPVFALGNALLTQTIAGNLLKNALEAEPAGRVVAVRFLLAQGLAGFAVSNPTPPPPEIVPVFFEKYATSGKRGGSGLGTYSARLMAECQGGEIRLDASEAAGVTVTVRLPAA
ncbi:PAS domain S-box protein [Desulfovibrio aerotolerans]|uniref:histidine kinase n=1 Tax=Solidesulfovibrio aerotolerans TaxID=295255 RepID=A0A7C9INI3_9BACT|nr:PAS domain S-box protein [Solidesulfovibrio aerotolerans]MYL83199.1 PAS domain S-box protein [Solidesulfovibrio aerotolerans]